MIPIEMEQRAAWRSAANPAELFLLLWAKAIQWDPADLAILPDVSLATRAELRSALTRDDGAAAVAALLDILKAEAPSGSKRADVETAGGALLATMRAIDDAFTDVHPRTRFVSPAMGAPADPVPWLDTAQRDRLRQGYFAERDGLRLVPHGPFARSARGQFAEAGSALRNRFAYLQAGPTTATQNGRPITIAMKVVGTDIMRGVPARPVGNPDRIRFIPIAEAVSDLDFQLGDRNGHPVLNVQPTINGHDRLMAALTGSADIDLAFAPELTIAGGTEDALKRDIAALKREAPRIILAGTGLTVERGPCGRSWNEARVFARGGHLLWRQRKLWPYEMGAETACHYQLVPAGSTDSLIEDVAGCSEITIVDIDGFGRCVVTICQDFKSGPLLETLIGDYQPDWILTPILDPGVKVPGWAHQRATALSHISQSRFVVGSSLTMTHMSDPPIADEPPVGLAVGPYDGEDGSPSRAVALVHAVAGPAPRSGLLVWDGEPATWKQTNIGAADQRA